MKLEHYTSDVAWDVSLTGAGVRETLDVLGERLTLNRARVPSGSRCLDWVVPDEWTIRDAYIKDSNGRKVVAFQAHNLDLVGYSRPVHRKVSLAELRQHLHSLPEMPDAIPYRASYYHDYWGFCVTHRQRESLCDGGYDVCIDATLEPGHLDYADCVLKGDDQSEIFPPTYVCHPSLANNELSGPVVASTLIRLLATLPARRHTYRAFFGPERLAPSRTSRTMLRGSRSGCVRGTWSHALATTGP